MTDEEISRLLRDLAGDEAAASHQGSLYGRASAAPATVATAWPAEVLEDLPDTPHSEDIRAALAGAALRCVEILEGGQLDLNLALPGDGSPLNERAAALAQWCQGYLVGLASAGLTNFDKLPGDTPEFLSDVLAISQVGADDDDEASEVAFTELVEYLRVGVQLVRDELAALTPSPTVQ